MDIQVKGSEGSHNKVKEDIDFMIEEDDNES
jgi:hypothetical protein